MKVHERTIAIANAESANSKIGRIAVTYAAQQSCPSSCVFRNAGCYAEEGYLGKGARDMNANADELDAGPITVAIAEALAIDRMEVVPGRPMRLHSVGDCSTPAAARLVAAAAARYIARGGGRVWTYTHAWRDVPRELWDPVSVLASCETAGDVADARERGYAPSVVLPEFRSRRRYSHDGVDVLPCPAQTTDGVTCASCRLCTDDAALRGRGYAIAFEVHGSNNAVKKAKLSLEHPDDESRKLSSRDHALAYMREYGEWPSSARLARLANVTHGSAKEMLQRMRAERRAA